MEYKVSTFFWGGGGGCSQGVWGELYLRSGWKYWVKVCHHCLAFIGTG